jgi:hypothetical protein
MLYAALPSFACAAPLIKGQETLLFILFSLWTALTKSSMAHQYYSLLLHSTLEPTYGFFLSSLFGFLSLF